MDQRDLAPAAWNQHWDSMPNSVNALYARLQRTSFPWNTKEVRIEAWGQLCFDDAAASATAYHMYNHGMRTGWEFISWRCEMDGPCVGGAKKMGVAPAGFDIYNYVPKR